MSKIGREARLLATSSPPTRHGELSKAERKVCSPPARTQLAMASYPKKKIGREVCLLAMASKLTCEASKGG